MKTRRVAPPTKIVVGRNIRLARKAVGLSQELLGEAAGLSQVSVSAIERGVTATNLDILDRLANALRTTTPQLVVEGKPPT